jgi:hypothetical protein
MDKSISTLYNRLFNNDEYMDIPLNHRPRERFGQDRSPVLVPHVTQQVTCPCNMVAATFANICQIPTLIFSLLPVIFPSLATL